MLASSITLFLHIILASRPAQKLISRIRGSTIDNLSESDAPHAQTDNSLGAEIRRRIASLGGGTIFAYVIVRLLACLALLGLSIASLVIAETSEIQSGDVSPLGKWGKKHRSKNPRSPAFSVEEWLDVAMCITFVSHPKFLLFLINVLSVLHLSSGCDISDREKQVEQGRH